VKNYIRIFENLKCFHAFVKHVLLPYMTPQRRQVYEKFNQKIRMNQNIGIVSMIERNLLYNLHYSVFSSRLILEGTAVKSILHQTLHSAPTNLSTQLVSQPDNSIQFYRDLKRIVKLVTLTILVLNYSMLRSISTEVRVKYYQCVLYIKNVHVCMVFCSTYVM
jgi:hypothetical protein